MAKWSAHSGSMRSSLASPRLVWRSLQTDVSCRLILPRGKWEISECSVPGAWGWYAGKYHTKRICGGTSLEVFNLVFHYLSVLNPGAEPQVFDYGRDPVPTLKLAPCSFHLALRSNTSHYTALMFMTSHSGFSSQLLVCLCITPNMLSVLWWPFSKWGILLYSVSTT